MPKEITVVGCLAHVRRKFDEALKSIPEKSRKDSNATIGLAYCNKLFALEENFAPLTCNERFLKRKELSRPLLNKFHSILKYGSM